MCMSNDDGIFNARSVMCFSRSLLYGSAPTAKFCLAFLVAALSECVSASELLPEAPVPPPLEAEEPPQLLSRPAAAAEKAAAPLPFRN